MKTADNSTLLADQVLEATLKHILFDGWSEQAIEQGLKDLELDFYQYHQLFDGQISCVIAHYSDWLDRQMIAKLQTLDLENMRIRDRIAEAVMIRLQLMANNRDAAKQACSYLAMPHHAPLGTKLLYKTVSQIWYAAGDTATDFNFYSKRTLLAGVYSTTILYWFKDMSDDFANTRSFLERRIDNVMVIQKLKAKVKKCWPWSR